MNSYFEEMCGRCDGLCCRVYDIIDSETGILIKQAGQKCGYLDTRNHCCIYTHRDRHRGYKESCNQYDCRGSGPIVTEFVQRISESMKSKSAISSSLLETIRLKIESMPEEQGKILSFSARGLAKIQTNDEASLLLAVKVLRVKIGNLEK